MYTPPPPPPPGIHRPAPEVNTTKSAENYRPQGKEQTQADRPYHPYAQGRVVRDLETFYNGGNAAKHTNLHHKRKQAKQRFKRNRK